jgi:hypothetical protein
MAILIGFFVAKKKDMGKELHDCIAYHLDFRTTGSAHGGNWLNSPSAVGYDN